MKKIQNVPHYQQAPGSNECWFACFQMIRVFHKKLKVEDLPLEKLKNDYKNIVIGGVQLGSLYSTGAGDDVIWALLEKEQFHYFYRYSNQSDYHSKIRESIDQGRPVIVGLCNGNYSHFVVVAGYNDDGSYIIHDPLKRSCETMDANMQSIMTSAIFVN